MDDESTLEERVAKFAKDVSDFGLTVDEASTARLSVFTPEVARDMLLVIEMGMILRPGYADVRAGADSHKK